jgi:Transposase IS200 like
MSRANGGDLLFRGELDRHRFLWLLSELPERFSLELHAFVLMAHHYHLLLRCREANLSHAIRWLQTSYAGRFKSVLILEESRLDEVGRYLHLNPVRIAGLGPCVKQRPDSLAASQLRVSFKCKRAFRVCRPAGAGDAFGSGTHG